MKKALLKNSLKSILKNKKRFLSMLFMALLGVGFFAGLTAASPDMEDTLDKYLDETKTYDISIQAILGLTEEDVQKIEETEGIEEAYGIKEKDYLIEIKNKEYVARIIEYNEEINTPYIEEGRIIENDNECVLDEKFALYNNYKIGDKIQIKTEDESVLKKELTIVGLCKSPLYISNERGTTTLGTGTINCYIYGKRLLDFDYYTSICARVLGATEVKSQSKKYDELVENAKESIEMIKETREKARENQLIEDTKKQMIDMGIPEENIQLPEIEQNKWYIQTRTDNSGYYGIVQAIESITNLAGVFPIVFYIIAVLISLTSMTRMVEEERTEIGTLKALGYSNRNILFKYILYASIACIVGGIIGMIICFYLLPAVIWNTYGLLYKVPNLMTPFRIENGLIGLGIAFICIVGATFAVCRKELMSMPSNLMRPKAPKAGKRVFLERIKIVWDHISFSKKVTIRNLFRYKKKALMTIIGIAGCTALTLSGFGLRDSITKIVSKQYGETYKYDGMIYLKENSKDTMKKLQSYDEITEIISITAETGEVKKDNIQKTTNIIIPEDKEEFEKVCTLYDENLEEVNLGDNGVIITDKLAEMLNTKEGDTIILSVNDGKGYEFKVQDIVRNYIDHYVYISKENYENVVGKSETNLLWINTIDLNKNQQNTLSEKILQDSNIASITMIDGLIETINDMLKSLDYVIIILIMASAILALTVLYNLANVNISERKREIATLKVLGFYNKEVDAYISRESIIFTVAGIAIGLVRGIFLN